MDTETAIEVFHEMLEEVRETVANEIEALQVQTLTEVARNPGQMMLELADNLGCERSTVSRNVAFLGRHGNRRREGLRLLREETDINDRRQKRVYLDARGEELVLRLQARALKAMRRIERRKS